MEDTGSRGPAPAGRLNLNSAIDEGEFQFSMRVGVEIKPTLKREWFFLFPKGSERSKIFQRLYLLKN
jgi:hypothetical protein